MENTNSTVKALIFSGLFALLGTIVGGVVQGYWNVKLAEQKYQSDLILKALESDSPDARLQTLQLLVHTNLIKESDVRLGITAYIDSNKKDPTKIPQVKSAGAQLESPIIDNARVYLLTGNKSKTTGFTELRIQLAAAGFKVLDSRYIVDTGRPNTAEVRYFNAEDQQQAEKIAQFMSLKFNDKDFAAKLYQDARAKSGYIEIWLGR